GGEQAVTHTDWSPLARFPAVAVVPDRDEAGRHFALLVAATLRRQAPTQAVHIVDLPGLPPKGDIVEWIAAVGTADAFRGILAATPETAELEAIEDDDDPCR